MEAEMDVAGTRSWDEPEQWRLHQRRFATQEYLFIVISGDPVGFIARVITAELMRVNQLFVLPQHQGKGLGEFTMREMLAEADRLNLPVRLQVLKTNPRAFAFYSRSGFVEIEATATHQTMERACRLPSLTDEA